MYGAGWVSCNLNEELRQRLCLSVFKRGMLRWVCVWIDYCVFKNFEANTQFLMRLSLSSSSS